MTTFNISLPQLQVFFFIFLRVGAIIMTVPVFDSKNIPVFFKAGLAFAISIILFPILKLDNTPFTTEAIPFGIGIVGEIMMGIIIGLSVRLIFAGVQLAGQVAGFQMGFAIANIMDPVESSQVPVIAALKNLVAMLTFLAVNAHHWFLRSLVDSFQLMPPFGFHFTDSLMEQLMRLGGNMFIIAIKIGAPIMAVMLLTSVAFGLIARTVPQMHIFIVAIPVKILIGLLFLGFSLPIFSVFLRQIFDGLGSDIIFLLRAMS
jgi:flagellar biosynthetic protein FliR